MRRLKIPSRPKEKMMRTAAEDPDRTLANWLFRTVSVMSHTPSAPQNLVASVVSGLVSVASVCTWCCPYPMAAA
jgi:hypothetical protein